MKQDTFTEDAGTSDLKKPFRATGPMFTDAFFSSAQAAATFWDGLMASIRQAVGALHKEFERERDADAGVPDSLIKGILVGNARFFDGMAEASRAMLDDLQEAKARTPPNPQAEIDYEYLAKLVVEELRKRSQHENP